MGVLQSFATESVRWNFGRRFQTILCPLVGAPQFEASGGCIGAIQTAGNDHLAVLQIAHHLVRRVKFSGRIADRATVEEILDEQLRDPNDPWELRHYRDRIGTYYGTDEHLVLAALDSVAAREPVALDTLFNEVKAAIEFGDREHLRNLLTLLQRDHYVRRDRAGHFEFSSPIIRRWWQIDRGL